MAPEPPDKFSNNRFSVLRDFIENRPKKQKLTDYPDLPILQNGNNHNPKYVVISSTDPNKPLSTISPFAIKKGIECISTEYTSITTLRDGKLLILTRNARAADKFLKTKSLANLCPISCKLHETLNFVKGVIYAPCLISVPEQEIVQEMKNQGVTSVYKFTKLSEDGKSRVPSGKIILTFDLYRLPSSVEVAWYKCKVDHYFPNPMRCKNCQKLGHTKNRCNGNTTCPVCSLPPHEPTECTRTFCTNCSGEHSSSDNNCPRYIQMKEVLKIKTENYCSIGEARRKYRELNPIQNTPLINSYASITSNNSISREQITNNILKKAAGPTPSNHTLNKKTSTTVNQLDNTHKRSSETTQSKNTTKATDDNKVQKTTIPTNSNNTKTTDDNRIQKTTTLTDNVNNNKETNKHQLHNSAANSFASPISRLTQSLIKNNNYYIPTLNEDDSSDVMMELLSKEP